MYAFVDQVLIVFEFDKGFYAYYPITPTLIPTNMPIWPFVNFFYLFIYFFFFLWYSSLRYLSLSVLYA